MNIGQDTYQQLLASLARPAASKMVLLVLDGVGDLCSRDQPETALRVARTPHLDALAKGGSLGRLVPVATGITPGSGPGHLGLFGYDPIRPDNDIGRGVLEALGLALDLKPTTLAVRGNFATADHEGRLTDRRAGRIPTSECQRLCNRIATALEQSSTDDFRVSIFAGESHRFVLTIDGPRLSARITDTDPQRTGVPPLLAGATNPTAEDTAKRIRALVSQIEDVLEEESQANRILLRGFSKLPDLPPLESLYHVRCGAFAGYPLYRGVASACGMSVVPCEKHFADMLPTIAEQWNHFDFFFVHVKQTDQAGEDGNLEAKAKVLEQVDEALPGLLELEPTVVAITGDHSTPAPMAAHSWHPVPLLIHSPLAFVDQTDAFDEIQAISGALGTLPSRELIGLMLAHAGRLAKFGA